MRAVVVADPAGADARRYAVRMTKILDYVRGNWSATKPSRSGIYLVRQSGEGVPWVLYWENDARSPFGTLEGDADGEPTRWDDARVAAIARKSGWTEAVPRRR